MRQVFSPRQVARAIGASESSVKRWCDRGVLPSIKTAGGHRRLPISGVLEFLRTEKHVLANPQEIGLPDGVGANSNSLEQASEQTKQAFLAGNYAEARRILLDLFLAQHSVAVIFDRVFAVAMQQIGDGWCNGDVEIFEERQGCEIASRLMYELRSMLPLPSRSAPVAMGASIEHDPYVLPTRMVELVLVESGWNAMSLGAGIPMESLERAIDKNRPRLFWLSISGIGDEQEFLMSYESLQKVCGKKTALVVGGRALTESLRERMQYSTFCENLHRLEAFAQAIHHSTEA